jgi:hypothetical protein
LETTRGIAETVKYLKSSRLAVTRYLSGNPLSHLEGVELSEGWPKWLLFLHPLSLEGSEGLRTLMTLLTSLRSIKLSASLDISPIVTPSKADLSGITPKEFDHVCRQLRIYPKQVSWDKFHMSTKSGPIGQAITSSVTELTLLPHELIHNIVVLGGDKLGKVIEALRLPRWSHHSVVSIWSSIFRARKKGFRKLSYFPDKEGKTRVIAILDYWSQTCLRPYHDALNSILKRIRADCTYDQGRVTTFASTFRGPFFSLDLSNATDRMPLSLQMRIFERLFGEEKAKAWAHVLVGYEYTSKDSPSVMYNAGQPMGAYSSWPAMALTHHFIVRLSALRAGKPHYNAYCLLGDDLVLTNAAVAQQYKDLCACLDMPISEAKSHVSEKIFEFAKRWFISGQEFTGFSIAGLFSVWKSYALLHNYLDTQRGHGWSLATSRHPELVSAIYRVMGKAEQSARTIKLYMVFDSVTKVLNVKEPQYRLISERVEEFFGIQVSSHVPLLQGETLDSIAYKAVLSAKKRLVERDLGRFQKDAYSVSAKLTGSFLRKYPDLSAQDYRAALRGNHPLVSVLNSMILESVHVLRTKYGRAVALTTARSSQFQALEGNPDMEIPDTTYLNEGVSKYFVSKGVFTMRASHSITLTKAQVVKETLNSFRELLGLPKHPDFKSS